MSVADKTQFYEEMGQRIARIRNEKGLKQSYINTVLNKHAAWLSHIEHARYEISALELYQVSLALGVEVEQLYSG